MAVLAVPVAPAVAKADSRRRSVELLVDFPRRAVRDEEAKADKVAPVVSADLAVKADRVALAADSLDSPRREASVDRVAKADRVARAALEIRRIANAKSKKWTRRSKRSSTKDSTSAITSSCFSSKVPAPYFALMLRSLSI